MSCGANTGAEPSPSRTLPWLWVAASRTTFSPERTARGANTGAEPSPSCTLPWLWVAASRTTFSPERMARGANTGAEPSPSCTLLWLWGAASRTTFSPTPGRRAFTISHIECLLFMKVPLPGTPQPKSIGTEHLLDSGIGAIGARYWHWPGQSTGTKVKNVIAGYFWLSFRERAHQNMQLSPGASRIKAARAAPVGKLVDAPSAHQNGKPTRNSPACAARPAVGDALCADEDRARDHPAGYLGCGARRIGGGGALDHCALHGLQDPGAAGFCRRAVCTRLSRVRDSVRAHRSRPAISRQRSRRHPELADAHFRVSHQFGLDTARAAHAGANIWRDHGVGWGSVGRGGKRAPGPW